MQTIPTVKDFMATKVITVRPDMMIMSAIQMMLNHRISGIPVADENEKLVGIITEKDCLRILTTGAYHGSSATKVMDYMSSPVATLPAHLGLFAVTEQFMKKHYRRFPVVNEFGRIIGIVSRRDLLEASRRLWSTDEQTPDSGYLTDAVKARLGNSGITHIHKRTHL